MKKITLCIADDHKLFRKAIVKVLKDFKRVGKIREAGNGCELLKLVDDIHPDVVLLDLEMPVLDGVKTCEALKTEFPDVKVIVLSMHDSKTEICYMLQIGAEAFLSKNADPEELKAAIYAVADKGIYRNKLMQQAIRQQVNHAIKASVSNFNLELSKRELNIIKLLCKEFTNKQIGSQLSLSENTIRNHKVRMMRKAGVKNTPGLVRLAYERGLI